MRSAVQKMTGLCSASVCVRSGSVRPPRRRMQRASGEMAWAGKPNSQQKTAASFRSRRQPRPLPPPENPLGVPRAVMKQLAAERLPAEAISGRLQELLAGFRGGYTEEVLQFDATASKPPEACDAVSGGSSN